MNMFEQTEMGNQSTYNEFLAKVFLEICVGLLITFAVACACYMTGNVFLSVMHPFAVIIAQLGLAWLFTYSLYRMPKAVMYVCYGLYSALLGMTFAILPLLYDGTSIAFAVGLTAVIFACMAFIGHNTHIDLSRYSTYMVIGLISIIVITVLNIFFIHSNGLDLLLTYVGVLLFLAITAWDVQRLRAMYLQSYSDSELSAKIVIYAAFQLYLDFVNLFIRILQIFGRRRN